LIIMTKMSVLKEIIVKKQEKNLSKFNSCREQFEKIKKNKIADLKKTGEIVEEMNNKFKWWHTIP
jgi:septation ring formation regulator EzrA